MKKRIVGILLALSMVICLVPIETFAETAVSSEIVDITGSGTQDDPYLIYTADGLKVFRDKANGGERYAFATLMNDIVLNDGTFDADGNYTAADGSTAEPEKWTPIGTDNNQYRGTFDGNGKTVKGLYVNTGGDEPVGLFGFTGGPKIRNLTVDGCVVGKDWAGGILGFSHGGVIENCTNNASITVANLDSDRHACVGGIAGVTYAKLIGCGNTGKITVKNVAQIANVGGIVGCQNNMGLPIIHDCYNTGEVSGEAGILYLGGIAGAISQGVISNCYSTGKLDSTGSTTVYLGGIVGLNGALYDLTNNYYLEGTADKAAGRDEQEMIDNNTVKPMPKEAFGDGTILNLMINGREDGTHPWNGECGYVESAGMALPILKREESLYAHTHCICGTGTDFDGHDTHTDVTWTPWTKPDELPAKAGYYFLTDDVVFDHDFVMSGEVNICLNGYGIRGVKSTEESDNPVLSLNGSTLTITDCGTKGTVKNITVSSGKFIMYGGSVPVGSGLTIGENGELTAAGNAAISGKVTNNGTVSGGTFNGEVFSENGTITGGTFNGKVTNKGGDIYNGIFSSDVDNVPFPHYREDLGMTVGSRTSWIYGGTFTETSKVNNIGCVIQDGTFSGSVINNGYSDGTSSYGIINGGIFTETSEVTILRSRPELPYKEGRIKNGNYYGRVNLDGGDIDDGEFSESSEVDLKHGKVFGGVYYGKVTFGEAVIHDNACRYLSFDTDGGSIIDAQRILRGQKAEPPTVKPVKAGYIFGGWTEFDFTKPMLENATLTAIWTVCDHSGHTGENPDCTTSVICTECGGTIAALGHDFSVRKNDGNEHWNKCSRCDAIDGKEPHDWDTGEITVPSTCTSAGEKTYTCDECGATKTETVQASGHDLLPECQHNETHHWHDCRNCDDKIDYEQHIGGKATCSEKAVCEVCGKAYGELDGANHTDIKHVDSKAATETAEGNIEYWYCDGCEKYYGDTAATSEITKADTVTAKLPSEPNTGDSSLSMWILLLFVSGGITAFGIKKKFSAE